MRKIITVSIFIFTFFIGNTFAEGSEEYYKESVEAFKNSPSAYELDDIEDDSVRYCEQIYLEAYRRREFTEEEQELCSEIFQVKIQQELDYMYYTLGKRGIYY